METRDPLYDYPIVALADKVNEALAGRSIVFVGMMGSGKSVTGRSMAELLCLPFADSDDEIVKISGRSISSIFAEFGEGYFRKREEQVISSLLKEEQRVIAIGGGAFMSETNRSTLIAHRAVSVWIHADFDLLVKRVQNQPGTRPLLDDDYLSTTMQKILKKRLPIYKYANVSVRSDNGHKSEIAEQVLRQVADFLRRSREFKF